MTTSLEKEALLFELHQAQDEREALVAKRLALSNRMLDGFVDETEKSAWQKERDEVDRAINEVLDKIESLLERCTPSGPDRE